MKLVCYIIDFQIMLMCVILLICPDSVSKFCELLLHSTNYIIKVPNMSVFAVSHTI